MPRDVTFSTLPHTVEDLLPSLDAFIATELRQEEMPGTSPSVLVAAGHHKARLAALHMWMVLDLVCAAFNHQASVLLVFGAVIPDKTSPPSTDMQHAKANSSCSCSFAR